MAVPEFRRLSIGDYPTAPNWLGQVFVPLNVFCSSTVGLLDQGLVFGENVQGQKQTATFTTPADYLTGGFSAINFNYTGGGQPTCLLMGKIVRSDAVKILTAVSVSDWVINLNTSPLQMTVNYIAGLSPSTKYTVTFVAL